MHPTAVGGIGEHLDKNKRLLRNGYYSHKSPENSSLSSDSCLKFLYQICTHPKSKSLSSLGYSFLYLPLPLGLSAVPPQSWGDLVADCTALRLNSQGLEGRQAPLDRNQLPSELIHILSMLVRCQWLSSFQVRLPQARLSPFRAPSPLVLVLHSPNIRLHRPGLSSHPGVAAYSASLLRPDPPKQLIPSHLGLCDFKEISCFTKTRVCGLGWASTGRGLAYHVQDLS